MSLTPACRPHSRTRTRTRTRTGPRSRRGLRLSLVALLGASCLGGLLLAPAAGAAGDTLPGHGSGGSEQTLQQQLDELVGAPGGPPGVIVVLQRDRTSRVLRAGVADLETGRPIEPTDHMRIASTAKAFSGAVALSLVQRGALGLDSTIGRTLPRLPRAWRSVTLRQLLNHTSGLPDYTEDPEFLELLLADPRRTFDPRRLLDFVADEPLRFRPGSRYRYSNSDNIAVALMAEAVTRRPYEELLSRLVYRPLGLTDTSLPLGYEMPEPYMHGYAVEPPAPPEDVSEALSASGVWASGGIVSTPRDLTRFIRGYAAGELTSRSVLREQRRWIEGASEPAGPGRNRAGLALFRYDTRCGVVLGHTGNFPGYTQLIAATPDGRRSLTFSLTTQVNRTLDPGLLERLRAVEENAVCELLGRRGD
ncbi:serine hydrolase domain-containing protein [Streptomyces stelliscabiei]|uniref:D-alanyl-D-alanine carboxypeptidase n=1 Tax=Streptomyces stelliscabiei TaxID=146820 RepID=A0A8I0P1C2_9ACTN|nr:serine hydrolase domain-containing protein [Streptomyces stelliscabiei]KND42051.1 peptidase S12 [Streptomyces stelliscabiei]MBE1595554.1 D-alanyl-D-alanine carboxypeptidase [Streptomyces stelliscabiei]MDX2517205.1 serine hydrolase [Streptomyces stelliscabiei]MDX2557701.1 serine hydrolase [Streptomyces stelliscabiei]MDX2617406.1 serine hydrolase [Streptomyces stelliscabiei]